MCRPLMKSFTTRFTLMLCVGLVVLSPRNTTIAEPVRTVALTGQQAPGTPSGVSFATFRSIIRGPVINAAGQTAFFAALTGNDVDASNSIGLWSESSGNLELIARTGNYAHGTPSGVNYVVLQTQVPVLNAAGQMTFHADLGSTRTSREGIWIHDSSDVALVARSGDAAPDTPVDVSFSRFGNSVNAPLLNDLGDITFLAHLRGTEVTGANDRAIWSGPPNALMLIAREGDQAPGTPSGTDYGVLISPVLNSRSQTAFNATLTGSGVTPTNNQGVWLQTSSEVQLVARSGDQAPDTPSGVAYANFSPPTLNTLGQLAFQADLAGSGVNASNNAGVWSGDPGALKLIARKGNQAPGTPTGVNFDRLLAPVLNNAGQTAFVAFLTGDGVDSTNNRGIWSERAGALQMLVRTGTQAPGTPAGVRFNTFGPPSLNAAGQVMFAARLVGSGVNADNDLGIWATDADGSLTLIVRTGELLEVAPTDFRTIRSLVLAEGSGNGDGRPSGFNDLGQIVFIATFTDSTGGVLVSNVAAIPEPAALTLVGIALSGVTVARRRERKRSGQNSVEMFT
jgi:hypothetical protein